MKKFKFYCPHCNQKLEAQDDMEGIETTCPSCNNMLTVTKPKIILKAINDVSFTEKCRDGLHKTYAESIPLLKAFGRKSISISYEIYKRSIPLLKAFGRKSISISYEIYKRSIPLLKAFGRKSISILHMTYQKTIPIFRGIYKIILQCLKKNRVAVHTFKFYCPHCNKKLEAQDDMEGVETVCPSCKNNISIIKPKLIVSRTIFDFSFISREVVLVLVILSIVWFTLFIPILNLIIVGITIFLSIALFLCRYKNTACFIVVNSIFAMSIVIVTSTNLQRLILPDSEKTEKIISTSSFSNTDSTTEKSRKRSKETEELIKSLEELQESIQRAQRNRNYQNNQNFYSRSNDDFVRYKKKCGSCFGTGFTIDNSYGVRFSCNACNGTGFEAGGGPSQSWRNARIRNY